MPHNRELVVIQDMESFANCFCYVKKQKPGTTTNNNTSHSIADEHDPGHGLELEMEEKSSPEEDDI